MSTLEAGRELDALIAVQFFGYRWRVSSRSGRRCVYPPDTFPTWMDTLATGDEPLVADWHSEWARWTPAYSTDIAAAWLVVEKMRELGFWPQLRDLVDWDNARKWQASFDQPPRAWNATADSAPLAICRASLLSLEEHQSDG